MVLSPDAILYWQWGVVKFNATLAFSLLVMLLLVVTAWLTTRRLTSGLAMSRGQNLLEAVVEFLRGQIREVTRQDPDPYLPFIGTLFLFIVLSNILAVVPGFQPPTGSLSTTAALAVCVFAAVPVFGIRRVGVRAYFRQYLRPSPLMLPFNIISELSRTLSLAVRLFGNIMSGTVIVAILVAIAPLLFPMVMQLFGLLIGVIQAYIFAILAAVFIASATQAQESRTTSKGS